MSWIYVNPEHVSLELVIFLCKNIHIFFPHFCVSFLICIDRNVFDKVRKQFHNYSSVLRSKKKKKYSDAEGSQLLCNTGSAELPLHVPWLRFFLSFIFPYYCSQGRNLNIFNTSVIFLCLMFTSLVSQLTPWSWVVLEKPVVPYLLKNWPTFHGTQTFIPCNHWSLFRDRWFHFTSFHYVFLTLFTILPLHLQHDLLRGMIGFPVKTLYAVLLGKEMWKGCFTVTVYECLLLNTFIPL
jgi:hypothetical protein